jgi:hypothetical protein
MRTHQRFQADPDFSVFHREESSAEDGPLDHQGGQEQVESYRTVTIPLQEGHQEAETDEDHHVDVLKHWKTQLW